MVKFDTKFESGSVEWETPEYIFAPLNKEFKFTCDVAASEHNTKCENFIGKQTNALSVRWEGVCWLNPPFSQTEKWVKKAYLESQRGVTVVMLLPARTNTRWWNKFCTKANEIRFIQGRPKFVNAKYGLPQPLAIVIFQQTNQQTKYCSWKFDEKYDPQIKQLTILDYVK